MGTTIPADALGIVLSAIAQGLQKRIKTCIERLPLVYSLKAGLKGLPQFLWRRLHGSPPLLTCQRFSTARRMDYPQSPRQTGGYCVPQLALPYWQGN